MIIRCDIVKGKGSNNLNRPGFDATPRAQEGYVLDLGNIGKIFRKITVLIILIMRINYLLSVICSIYGLQFNIKTKNVWQSLLALCTRQLYNFILFDN